MRGRKVQQLIVFFSVLLLTVSVNIKGTKAEDVHMQDYISQYSSLSKDNIITTKNYDNSWSIKKTDDGDFRVLQLTDVHLSAGDVYTERNKKAMDAVYDIVSEERPDLIEMTGDYVFAMSYTDPTQDYETFKMCVAFMDQLGVPWIWTFGNHDHEFFDRYSQEEVHAMLDTSRTLIKYDIDYSVDGYTNGEFRLYNSDNTLNRILISLDTHNYVQENDYDYVHDNQVAWYENVINNDKSVFGENVQSFVYTHIPIVEYDDAWNAMQAGDARAEYILGNKREDVCCSSIRGNLGTAMSNLKSTKAIFCGHDHVNDYIIKYCDIIYAYSKSIDYSAYVDIEYKTEQRGATLLTLNHDGINYNITSIKLTDIQSMPKKNGICHDSDDIWRYYVNGNVDVNYTGITNNDFGWWYVRNGEVDFSYTGVANNAFGWWYVENGGVDFNYTGLASNEYGWWYINNGQVDFTFTGNVSNENGNWLVVNGGINFDYTGLFYHDDIWWYVENGAIAYDYAGLVNNENGWWYVHDGEVDFTFTGNVSNENGEWLVVNGGINFDYTGLFYYDDIWWYIENGAVAHDYTSIAVNENGCWLVENGQVNFDYTGEFEDTTGVWIVTGGFAIQN